MLPLYTAQEFKEQGRQNNGNSKTIGTTVTNQAPRGFLPARKPKIEEDNDKHDDHAFETSVHHGQPNHNGHDADCSRSQRDSSR